MLAPLAAVVIFLVTILLAFVYLRLQEISREQEAIHRDVEYTQQRMRIRLLEQQEQLMRFAREMAGREISVDDFLKRAEAFANLFPEIRSLTWIDDNYAAKASFDPNAVVVRSSRTSNLLRHDAEDTASGFKLARDVLMPIYSSPQQHDNGPTEVQLHLPLVDKTKFKGDLLVKYSVDADRKSVV